MIDRQTETVQNRNDSYQGSRREDVFEGIAEISVNGAAITLYDRAMAREVCLHREDHVMEGLVADGTPERGMEGRYRG